MMNAKSLYVSFVKFGQFYVSVVLFSAFRAFYWDGKSHVLHTWGWHCWEISRCAITGKTVPCGSELA